MRCGLDRGGVFCGWYGEAVVVEGDRGPLRWMSVRKDVITLETS